MKGLNVRKLAAVGIGAALMGTALAPVVSAIDLTKDDVVTDGVPNVDVVVGAGAAASDVVSAANIAAALAQLTTVDTPVTYSVDVTPSEDDGEEDGEEDTVTTGGTVEVTVGGSKTVTGGRTYKNNMNTDGTAVETNFGGSTFISVTEDTLSHLVYEGSQDFTCQGTSYTATMQEKLQFIANPQFRDSTSNPGLGVKIGGGHLDVVIDLGSGIYDNEECTTTGTTNFSDDANDSIRIPLFGEWYYVNAYNRTNNQLTLVKTTGTILYNEGDIIEDLEGKDGGTYSLRMDGGRISSGVTKFYVTALDADGEAVTESTGFQAGEDMVLYRQDDGEKLLETTVKLDEILSASTEGGGTYYQADILIGTDSIEIRSGSGYPYDSTKTADDYDWDATITTSGGMITAITISNKAPNYHWPSTDLLAVGEEATWFGDYGTLKFLGLQLPEFSANGVTSTESVASFTLGDGQFVYRDNSYEAEHTLPFYIEVAEGASDEDYGTFPLDGKIFYYKIELYSTNDVNLHTGLGWFDFNAEAVGWLDINNGVDKTIVGSHDGYFNLQHDDNTDGYIEVGDYNFAVGSTIPSGVGNDGDTNLADWITVTPDANITIRKETSTGALIGEYYFDALGVSGEEGLESARVMDTNAIAFPGQSEVTHNYVPYLYEQVAATGANTGEAHFMLFLDDQNFTLKHDKDVAFKGTDVDESGLLADEGDYSHFFYEPNIGENTLTTDYNGGTSYSAQNYKVAQWVFYEDSTNTGNWDMNFFIDTETGDLLDGPAANTYLDYYATEVDYNAGGNGHNEWHMSEDATNYFGGPGYTDYGTKVELTDHVVTVTYPENRAQAEILVSGPATTTSVEGESPTEALGVGDTFTTTDGTSVEITAIGVTSAAGAAGGVTEDDVRDWVELSVETARTVVPLTAPLVVTDTFATAGPHIIVGGHVANSLAVGVTEDLLMAEGDYVADLLDTGNIIVAGYTAADTEAAAEELIMALEALLE